MGIRGTPWLCLYFPPFAYPQIPTLFCDLLLCYPPGLAFDRALVGHRVVGWCAAVAVAVHGLWMLVAYLSDSVLGEFRLELLW